MLLRVRNHSIINFYATHNHGITIAAVSVLKDCTANRGLDGILHSMFNIEDKLQDSHVKIESTGQQFSITLFFKLQ